MIFLFVSMCTMMYGQKQESNKTTSLNGKQGVTNAKDVVIIPCVYDSIEQISSKYYRTVKENKVGIIDINGKAVIPNEYEEIVQISEKYFQTTKDKFRVLYNNKGQ